MASYGPGGHKADGTGPHGRGAGPGKGTGTAEAYKKNIVSTQKPSLEGRVTGPGGGVPDASGTKGYGMGAGPGGGREDGTGLDLQREFEAIFKQHSGDAAAINSYISQYYLEANNLKLTGTERRNYVQKKVTDRVRIEKEKVQKKKESKSTSQDTEKSLERITDLFDRNELHREYGLIYSEYFGVDGISDYIKEYHDEAVDKKIYGQKRKDYVRNKIKEKTKKNGKKVASPKKTSKTASKAA